MDDIEVLTALERQPLTVENLSYFLGLPLEETRELVQRLWDKGYIDAITNESAGTQVGAIIGSIIGGGIGGGIGAVISGGIVGGIAAAIGAVMGNTLGEQIAPAGRQKKRQSGVDFDSEAYFILTLKGHYHLHPLLPDNS